MRKQNWKKIEEERKKAKQIKTLFKIIKHNNMRPVKSWKKDLLRILFSYPLLSQFLPEVSFVLQGGEATVTSSSKVY